MKPTTSKSSLYSLNSFEFGITYFGNMSSSYQSISNSDAQVYGIYANTTKVTLSTSGLGLPTTSFNQFANLLEIVTSGQVNCIKLPGFYCTLPQTCSNYPTLWDYSFRIAFSGDQNNNLLVVPLGSFASDEIIRGSAQCKIFVELLDENLVDSRQIVLGAMFF